MHNELMYQQMPRNYSERDVPVLSDRMVDPAIDRVHPQMHLETKNANLVETLHKQKTDELSEHWKNHWKDKYKNKST